MRTISSSVMAALVIVALFWGNCFSCPQLLLRWTAQNAAHECCKRTHKPASKTCDTQSLQDFVKTDPAAREQTVTLAVGIMPTLVAADSAPVLVRVALVAQYAPPDLLSLHSSFRI